jgi:hypothetical protein
MVRALGAHGRKQIWRDLEREINGRLALHWIVKRLPKPPRQPPAICMVIALGSCVIYSAANDCPPYGFKDAKLLVWSRTAADPARRLGVTLRIVTVLSSNRAEFLSNGEVDLVIATLRITDERRKESGIIDQPHSASFRCDRRLVVSGPCMERHIEAVPTINRDNCQGELRQFGVAELLACYVVNSARNLLVLKPRHGLGPCQRSAFVIAVTMRRLAPRADAAQSPPRAQIFRMHVEAKRTTIELRHAIINKVD